MPTFAERHLANIKSIFFIICDWNVMNRKHFYHMHACKHINYKPLCEQKQVKQSGNGKIEWLKAIWSFSTHKHY